MSRLYHLNKLKQIQILVALKTNSKIYRCISKFGTRVFRNEKPPPRPHPDLIYTIYNTGYCTLEFRKSLWVKIAQTSFPKRDLKTQIFKEPNKSGMGLSGNAFCSVVNFIRQNFKATDTTWVVS